MADPHELRLRNPFRLSDSLDRKRHRQEHKNDDPGWYAKHQSKTSLEATERYTERLRNVLTTASGSRGTSPAYYPAITFPATPVCCFTELKLSLSRRHAQRYGRLGIGVKRPFLFTRFGRLMCYYGFDDRSDDRFMQAAPAT